MYSSPHRHTEQLMGTGCCPDPSPSRLPLLLDRDHFRRCPKLGCPVPQVDYHALISERENRQLAGLFCPGWSRENGHFICHGSPRYLSRRADRYRHSFGRLPRRSCVWSGFRLMSCPIRAMNVATAVTTAKGTIKLMTTQQQDQPTGATEPAESGKARAAARKAPATTKAKSTRKPSRGKKAPKLRPKTKAAAGRQGSKSAHVID